MIETLWAIEQSVAGQIVAALRNPSGSLQPSSTVGRTQRGDVAIVEVRGVLTKYPSPLQMLFGGAAVTDLQDVFQTALADTSVKAVCIVIDSPGGSVAGIPALADAIFAARQSGKQVVVQVDGMLASAAYHFAAGASKIYATNRTDRVGSIGTMQVIQDTSKQAAMNGVDVFVASTGSLKPLGVPGVPITDDMKAYLQRNVEAAQADFTSAIQRGRRISANVLAGVSDGSVFSATDAKVFGLIDSIQSLETTLAQLQGSQNTSQQPTTRKPTMTTATQTKSYTQQWREGIDQLVSEGMDRARAVSQFVNLHPEVQQGFLAEASGRNAMAKAGSFLDPREPGPATIQFREGVAKLVAGGVDRAKAVSRFVAQNPDVHRNMLNEINGR